MSKDFHFKKFSICQAQSAMKVGTDGVLLGAWCSIGEAKTALDIGCGTGVIALMLAQRNPNLRVDAVEIDENSAKEAVFNVKNSPFKDRIAVFCENIVSTTLNNQYDLIVSNPPFFENSLKPPCKQRAAARHTDSLSFEQLVKISSENLTENGVFSVVLPALQTENFIEICKEFSLNLFRRTDVFTTPTSKLRRCLLEFSKQDIPLFYNHLTIEYSSNNFTSEYKNLMQEFYLKF
ncbi:MAG: methyltransferase [Prevotellaceae bacterium]|jgi:tRNA1Val (adenine37-N6)-methyltransferase|nr:methyltransferase [Prevotellaceae bacterium]